MMRMMIDVFPTQLSPTMQVFNLRSMLGIILLMLKAKGKNQGLGGLEEGGEEASSIYRMISQQEKTLDDILSKYKGEGAELKEQSERTERRGQTLDAKPNIYILSDRRKSSQRYSIHPESLQLPNIKSHSVKHPSKKKRAKLDVPKTNPYLSQILKKQDSLKMKEILEKAYLTEKAEKLRSGKRKKSLQKSRKSFVQKVNSPAPSSLQIQSKINLEPESSQNSQISHANQEKRSEKDIPEPLGYTKYIEGKDEDSSSNQGEVAVSYYERQFRGIIRSQSLQQTNFLYFSKNESMKDWTENLLLMFQKHDKELCLLRKRCKYLQKFDNNFFTIDIFRND